MLKKFVNTKDNVIDFNELCETLGAEYQCIGCMKIKKEEEMIGIWRRFGKDRATQSLCLECAKDVNLTMAWVYTFVHSVHRILGLKCDCPVY